MKLSKRGVALFAFSLLAGAAILLSAALIDARETSQTVTFVIIAIWFIPFSYLSARKARKGDKDETGRSAP